MTSGKSMKVCCFIKCKVLGQPAFLLQSLQNVHCVLSVHLFHLCHLCASYLKALGAVYLSPSSPAPSHAVYRGPTTTDPL